jgi:hypothetical protein
MRLFCFANADLFYKKTADSQAPCLNPTIVLKLILQAQMAHTNCPIREVPAFTLSPTATLISVSDGK